MAPAIAVFLVISLCIHTAELADASPMPARRVAERAAIRTLALHQLRARFGRRAHIALTDAPHGPPRVRVAGEPIAISWSHTNGCQVLATSAQATRIGVDVEQLSRLQAAPKTALRLARRLWPADLVQGLSQLSLASASRAVVRLWCLHEALSKCTEQGLARTPFSLGQSAQAAVMRGGRGRYGWWPVPACLPYQVRIVSGPRVPLELVVAVAAPRNMRVFTRQLLSEQKA